MIAVSFFHRETGLLNGIQLTASDDEAVLLNTPVDHLPVNGHHDHLSKRVDVRNPSFIESEDGERVPVFSVIDYKPPRPSSDHEWNDATKRWQLSAAAAAKIDRSDFVKARILQLVECQHRHVREHCLGVAGASLELQKIHDEITTLQKDT